MTSEALERARREFEQRTGRNDIRWVNVGECPYQSDEPKCAPHWLDTTEIDEAKEIWRGKTPLGEAFITAIPDEAKMNDRDEAYYALAESQLRNKQVGGDHYKKHVIQVWDIIDAYDLNFWEGNALKYLLRQKGNRVEDLQKAIHYLEKEAERAAK